MAGRVPSNSPAPVIQVAGAAVVAVVSGRRAIGNSWVSVDPVVGWAVEVVVVQTKAISLGWELVFVVGGVRPALAVGAVCLGVGPADGSRGIILRFPKADHQVHDERQALLLLPGARSHLDPGHVEGEVVLRQHSWRLRAQCPDLDPNTRSSSTHVLR